MKLRSVALVLVCTVLVAGRAGAADPRSKRLTPQQPDENFTVKVERVKGTDILRFRVTAKLKDNKDLPVTRGILRMYDGNEYIALCPVQPSGTEGERVFFFQAAAKYAEKSKFSYSQRGDFEFNEYWFYLKDFGEPK